MPAQEGKLVCVASGNDDSYLTEGLFTLGHSLTIHNHYEYLLQSSFESKQKKLPFLLVGAVSYRNDIVALGNTLRPHEGKDFNFLTAPGIHIQGSKDAFSGTSPATQYVNGAAALLWEAYPSINANQVTEILLVSGIKEPSWYPKARHVRECLKSYKGGWVLTFLKRQAVNWVNDQLGAIYKQQNVALGGKEESRLIQYLATAIVEYKGSPTPHFAQAKLYDLLTQEQRYYRNDLHIGRALEYADQLFSISKEERGEP